MSYKEFYEEVKRIVNDAELCAEAMVSEVECIVDDVDKEE